eukprot:s308_g66.t1
MLAVADLQPRSMTLERIAVDVTPRNCRRYIVNRILGNPSFAITCDGMPVSGALTEAHCKGRCGDWLLTWQQFGLASYQWLRATAAMQNKIRDR